MTDPTADEIINMETIESLRELGGDDDPGLVLELIDLYLQDAPDRINEIKQALETADFDLLERAAHTLKSSSANIGALGLSSMCAELEALARTNEVSDATDRTVAAVNSFAEVEKALSTIKG